MARVDLGWTCSVLFGNDLAGPEGVNDYTQAILLNRTWHGTGPWPGGRETIPCARDTGREGNPCESGTERPTGCSWEESGEDGTRLLSRETFDGNGRTCDACHPATNNFTIDPAFIRKLPRRDPLFVATFNPDLRGLEVTRLLRRYGLVLENLDGFDRPDVLRGVPHNLSLPVTTKSNLPHVKQPFGWSGGDWPDGTVRMFTLGAIVQHMPKRLARREGIDFRIATDKKLDVLEAFMRSLGRQKEINLSALTFTEDVVQAGKRLFNGEGVNRSCSGCHSNAGANRGDRVNANFDTGRRKLRSKSAPADGGFGTEHDGKSDGCGDCIMNTPSLNEAAGTVPFFHNNSARTLEDAIEFCARKTFAETPADGDNCFLLRKRQISEIGAFLRTVNSM